MTVRLEGRDEHRRRRGAGLRPLARGPGTPRLEVGVECASDRRRDLGRIGLGETVMWRATHFCIPFTMTSSVIELERPYREVEAEGRQRAGSPGP